MTENVPTPLDFGVLKFAGCARVGLRTARLRLCCPAWPEFTNAGKKQGPYTGAHGDPRRSRNGRTCSFRAGNDRPTDRVGGIQFRPGFGAGRGHRSRTDSDDRESRKASRLVCTLIVNVFRRPPEASNCDVTGPEFIGCDPGGHSTLLSSAVFASNATRPGGGPHDNLG